MERLLYITLVVNLKKKIFLRKGKEKGKPLFIMKMEMQNKSLLLKMIREKEIYLSIILVVNFIKQKNSSTEKLKGKLLNIMKVVL